MSLIISYWLSLRLIINRHLILDQVFLLPDFVKSIVVVVFFTLFSVVFKNIYI